RYLPTSTVTSFTIPTSVVEVAERAFYKNNYLQTLTFVAGTIQTGNSNGYTTTYPSNLTLARYAISENPYLTTIKLQNNSSGFGVILTSYAIASNPALTTLKIIGFQSILSSYAVYNNVNLALIMTGPATDKPFGSSGSEIFANIYIQPYAFFGSGKTNGTTVFYTNTYKTFILSHAFSHSRIVNFEFNINIATSGYNATVYHPDAFAVGVSVQVNENGDIVQTYESITIKVPSANLTAYQTLRGFSFYSSSISGVGSFPDRTY
ncbi:MAG: hypothetical protein CVV59_01375, partial [Tenericutes bacterium HGW-Tenericutes-4]